MLGSEKAPQTVEHYRQYPQKLIKKGITKNDHTVSTKNSIRGMKERWKKLKMSKYNLESTC
jgi:hypothetical protein